MDLVHSSWCVSLLQEANSETKNKEYKQIVFPENWFGSKQPKRRKREDVLVGQICYFCKTHLVWRHKAFIKSTELIWLLLLDFPNQV